MSVRVRLICTLIAATLVLTSAQCIMACAVADFPNTKDVTPCHQQHDGHAPKVPLACSHDLEVGLTAHLNAQISDCDFSNLAFTIIAALPAPVVAAGRGVPLQSPSPPGRILLSAVVLRI
jgi:hypothetical protein